MCYDMLWLCDTPRVTITQLLGGNAAVIKALKKNMRYRYWITVVAGIVLGLVFIISGVGKLLGQSAFLLSISSSGALSPAFANITATWLPWVELILGVFLIVGVLNHLTALFSVVLVGALIFYNSWMISHGLGYEPCACLGAFEKLFQGRLSTITALYVDIGLLALALVIYFTGPGKLLNIRPWFLGRGKAGSSS